MQFLSPELLVPGAFGERVAKPTPQADIYAFGMVILQVCKQDYWYCTLLCILFPGPHG